jgi:hypothetical protein
MTEEEIAALRIAFDARVARGNGCWLWAGYIRPNGYGSLKILGRNFQAHRMSVLLDGRDTPAGLDVCHHCDNRLCVNPAHLYVGTRQQNMADCISRGRHNKPVGEKHPRCKLSDSEVALIRRRAAAGEGLNALGREYRVHGATISRLVRGLKRQGAQA